MKFNPCRPFRLFVVSAIIGLGQIVTAASAVEAQHFTLTLGHYRFQPDTMVVTAGTPVILTLINEDKITPHNFTLEAPNAGLDISENISAGKSVTVEFTPTTPGKYEFYCNKKLPFVKSHRQRGMQGEFQVRAAR